MNVNEGSKTSCIQYFQICQSKWPRRVHLMAWVLSSRSQSVLDGIARDSNLLMESRGSQ
jgi:hypothetical protein